VQLTGRPSLPVDVRRPDVGSAGVTTDGNRAIDGDPAVRMDAVLDALPSPTLLLDADGTVVLANSVWNTAAQVLGDDRFRLGIGSDYFAMALSVRDDTSTRAIIGQLGELSRGERDSVSADYLLPLTEGSRWFHIQASRVDQAGHVVVTHTDVTSRVHAERTLSWQARHDHLTELPNRAYLHELIDAELQRPERPTVAVLFLDVDGFKEVNDSLGHEVGDDLLRQLATRLLAATRTEDTVGRLGGDEFVVLCRNCDAAGAALLANRLRATFDQPFDLRGRVVKLGASIGIAAAAPGTPSVRSTDLVRDAEFAMYAAKNAGRNRVHVFSPELRSAAEQRATLAAELRAAIGTGQLVLHYQPVRYLPTGQHTGVEALVRWHHPTRGLLCPGDFLPIAEQHELMMPLARWVLAEAARQTAAWAADGLRLVTGVNIHAGHFSSGTLVDDVMAAVRTSELAPEQLLVELTESAVAQDPERAAAQFAELRLRGVEVSIDDFGKGWSSLSQLVSIPAGMLKIDGSLITWPEGRRAEAAAAIAAVVALGRACGIRTLAEGVETAEQLAIVGELGCTFAQGYQIARPMPADAVVPWFAANGGVLADGPAADLLDAPR
jgi:diguanylate cyclase (GGDEF)-like protein